MAGLHTLQRTVKRRAASVGRGGKRGKTSGRGTKGQKSRAGNRRRPEMRDAIKKYPKRRGYGKNRARTVNSGRIKPVVVSLGMLDGAYRDGEIVSAQTLVEKGIIAKKGGHTPTPFVAKASRKDAAQSASPQKVWGQRSFAVKILNTGTLTKKLTIVGTAMSVSARAAVEKAGGLVK